MLAPSYDRWINRWIRKYFSYSEICMIRSDAGETFNKL